MVTNKARHKSSTVKVKEYKIDVFKLLAALNQRDFKFYSQLSDEEKKGFAGIVAMRWLSNVSDKNRDMCEYHIQMVNDGANKHFWNSEMQKHPKLQYLSLAVCGIGTKQRHEWIKGPAQKKQNKILTMLREFCPTASSDELEMLFDMNEFDGLIEIAIMLGYQDDQIKVLKKEIKEMKK